MNPWRDLSIEYANQRNYLDDLFTIYPTIPEGIRDIDGRRWALVENAYEEEDKNALIINLLALDLFPIKDSYVAYLKRDPSAINRNPQTINRLYGRLREMGLDKIYERCSEPKETNRQMGPLFKRWIRRGSIGVPLMGLSRFEHSTENAILDGTEQELTRFANTRLGYSRDKGLDFVARFNGKYVMGEAKFLTDFGGHQNAQFTDAISTIETEGVDAIKIAILDGILYIHSNNKMYRDITTTYKDYNIMSALVLREFLYQV